MAALLCTWGLERGSQAVVPTHICSTLPLPPPSSSRLSASLLLPVFFLHFSLFLHPYLQYDAKPQPLPPESVFQTGAKHQTAGQRPQARTGAIGTGVRTDRTGHPQALDCQLQAETRSIAEESQAEPRYVAELFSL